METTELSDSELVAHSLSGSREAFGRIMARYRSLICLLNHSATGNLNQSEDLARLRESAITGMRVNQSFDAALKIDPSNWEAQFFKADAMSYWPAAMNKGPEVIQRLSSLIDQQDTMPAQPEFQDIHAPRRTISKGGEFRLRHLNLAASLEPVSH